MKVLVSGAAGFIGSHLVKALAATHCEVVGLDNINSYYDVELKYARLADTGIARQNIIEGQPVQSATYPLYRFIKLDLTNREGLERLFAKEQFTIVVNLAAQAGVRYSLENPYTYVESNVIGFLNILENCRHHSVQHLVYASSSSVYGLDTHEHYAESDQVDSPVSLYAATKKSDELMAHVYSKLYGVPTTGLRFFTVYGPWGRPDMAPYLFLESVLHGKPIKVFNYGQMQRDFTYIDDVIEGILMVVKHPSEAEIPYRIYNIGHSEPVNLMDFISVIEQVSGRKAVKMFTEMQPGDVLRTCADISRLQHDFGYKPSTSIEEGIQRFYDWYMTYHLITSKLSLGNTEHIFKVS